LRRESKNALISSESQTNLLWKEGSQRDQSPEWAFSRRSLMETKPGSTLIHPRGCYWRYLAPAGPKSEDNQRLTRKPRHSIIEPFMLDENVEDVKVVGLNVLVIHKNCDFLGWLKTNAIFTDAKHIEELVARLVGKRPVNPSAES
jgi:hypothetical protein